MSSEMELNSGPLQEREVAIVGAGPVGLMIANLLGLAGVRVVVFERNKGLLGLPRAIAYDAETLRLFTQVGLFNGIAPGLIQNPHVRHLNARNVTLMAADFPVRSQFGHSALGTFYQPEFEKVLLNGLSRFDNVRTLFDHAVTGFEQDATGVNLKISTPIGLQVFYVKAQIGLLLIMIRRISLPRKPAVATRPPAKKPVARTLKAKLQAPVVTLKHLAAEIAEAHEVPKTRAETMLADTVARLARHLVKGNKVRIVGLGIFQVKRREARMGRDPQTGEPVKIKASKKVTFRAGKELKGAV